MSNIYNHKKNKDFLCHREDGPAIDHPQYKEWRLHNKLNRVDGPAVITSSGYQEHWVGGVKHRTDGPAVFFSAPNSTSVQEYWLNGMRHCSDAPACVYVDKLVRTYQEWRMKGLIHRANGPAITHFDGSMRYCIFGYYGKTLQQAYATVWSAFAKAMEMA